MGSTGEEFGILMKTVLHAREVIREWTLRVSTPTTIRPGYAADMISRGEGIVQHGSLNIGVRF